MPRRPRINAVGLLVLATFGCASLAAPAQPATPVAKLDPKQIIGSYYVIERLPVKREKACVADELVLYALGDKKRAIQIVTTCQVKQDNTDAWNSGGLQSKTGDGRIGIPFYFVFAKKYWILGVAPDSSWVIAGTPDHKSLWLLSSTPALDDATLAQLKSISAGQGYDTAKLIAVPQHAQLATLAGTPTPAAK